MAINRDKVLEAAQKFVEKKKYDKAVQEYLKLTEADPTDARTLLKIGDLQAKQNLYAEAIATYESVGKLYANQGFALKGIAVYKQIREIIGKHVPQLEERYGHIAPKLAELYLQLGLTSDALAALDEVATRLQRQQRDPEAIEVFRKIVELDPTNPLPHLRLAEALSRVKDIEGAVFEFKTAASQLAGIGRRDDALKVFERLLHHKPDADQARACAELYLSRGQPQDGMQALSKLQICFQANPRDIDTLSLLARAFNAIGQGGKAIEVQKEMARVARDAGKLELFREIVERLLRVAPHDDGVRKLSAQSQGSAQGSWAPPQSSASPASGGLGAPLSAAGSSSQVSPPALRGGPSSGYGAPPSHAQAPPASAARSIPNIPTTMRGVQDPLYGQRPPPLGRPATQPSASPPEPLPSLPRTVAAARFPVPPVVPEEDDIEEVDDLAYEEVDDDDALVEAYVTDADDDGFEQDTNAVGRSAQYEAAPRYTQDYGDSAGTAGEVEAVESFEEGPDTVELVEKALADAAVFRRMRRYDQALESLRGGLDVDPRSMDIHEIYRDILIECGQTNDAVEEMLLIAGLYVSALDSDSAARALQDVLAFDPQNAAAIEMLQDLGYEVVDEGDDSVGADSDLHEESARRERDDGYAEPQEPLPAYELDEIGSNAGIGQDFHSSRARASVDENLPSFPLDEPDADVPSDYSDARNVQLDDPGESYPRTGAPPHVASARPASVPPPPSMLPAASLGAASSQELEDALDEAEFFCSRGLLDDARAILLEQLSKHPNNPLLRERIVELDAMDEQRAASGARERPRDQPGHVYDIATSLDALESLDYDGLQPAEGHAGPGHQVDVEEVFAKFKEGVAKQISVDDSDSHYNLGIAYKEMMLLDDAIREFEVAAQDPKRECVCRSMIGMVEIERGRINEAIDAFLLGLHSPNKDPQQETVLCYEIGAAYEAKKVTKEALSYFQKAMRRDPNYRDVQDRVRRLAKHDTKPQRQAAVGADDEFDRAFDDLLSKA